jgi:hypothetical protein
MRSVFFSGVMTRPPANSETDQRGLARLPAAWSRLGDRIIFTTVGAVNCRGLNGSPNSVVRKLMESSRRMS